MLNIKEPAQFGPISALRLEAMQGLFLPRIIEFYNLIVYLISRWCYTAANRVQKYFYA